MMLKFLGPGSWVPGAGTGEQSCHLMSILLSGEERVPLDQLLPLPPGGRRLHMHVQFVGKVSA
jgi:hypothetical protein